MMKKTIFLLSALLAALTAGARSYSLENGAPVEVPADTVTVIESYETRTDTVKVRTGKTNIVVIETDRGKTEVTTYGGSVEVHKGFKKSKGNFSMGMSLFDLGMGNYSAHNFISGADGGDDFLALNTSKSIAVGIYPISVSANLTRNKALQVQTALGVEWNNYRFEQGWNIANYDGYTDRNLLVP
ncbi:MAG: hypothetical protein LBU95_00560 [Rikenellaceae bacterium]|jgi:hypothetical protein|nr:hypothetical protein [Rikenellaceae bacterium]